MRFDCFHVNEFLFDVWFYRVVVYLWLPPLLVSISADAFLLIRWKVSSLYFYVVISLTVYTFLSPFRTSCNWVIVIDIFPSFQFSVEFARTRSLTAATFHWFLFQSEHYFPLPSWKIWPRLWQKSWCLKKANWGVCSAWTRECCLSSSWNTWASKWTSLSNSVHFKAFLVISFSLSPLHSGIVKGVGGITAFAILPLQTKLCRIRK